MAEAQIVKINGKNILVEDLPEQAQFAYSRLLVINQGLQSAQIQINDLTVLQKHYETIISKAVEDMENDKKQEAKMKKDSKKPEEKKK